MKEAGRKPLRLKEYDYSQNGAYFITICVKQRKPLLDHGPMKASAPANIPQIVRSFKGLVTKQIGFSIWQRSYYDHVIRSQQDFEDIWNYIDTNPQRWIDKRRR